VSDRQTARRELQQIEELRDEARYRRERLELYRARRYAGRANPSRLDELQRAADGAAARLARAQARQAAPETP
jgi:hypothetical protein